MALYLRRRTIVLMNNRYQLRCCSPRQLMVALFMANACAMAKPCVAQSAVSTDTATMAEGRTVAAWPLDRQPNHHWLKFAAIAIGATVAVAPFDKRTAALFQRHWLQESDGLHQSASTAAFIGGPGPFLIGATLFGGGRLLRRNSFADVGLHLTESVVLAASINALAKGVSGRSLPNVASPDADGFSLGRGFHRRNGDFVSFPSGHTAAAFAMASVITAETRVRYPRAARYVGPIAYSGGVAVGLARMYQNVHWASDLPVAALIGTWSGITVVARQHHHPKNVLDRLLLGAQVVPTRDAILVAWTLRQ